MNADYSSEYFDCINRGSRASAEVVVPLVTRLIQPTSVIDIGCGTGQWLAAFKRHGVVDVMGVDGPYLNPNQLEIGPHEFMPHDLQLPLRIDREFDLAVSLEVAEHLPESVAEQFVEILATLAPVVLFSAAVPGQGGENHVNEQWPAYWIERIAAQDFAALDPFRRLLWQRGDVDWWYAQNMLLFVRQDRLAKFDLLATNVAAVTDGDQSILPLVHPGNYQQHTWKNRVLQVAVDLATVVGPNERLILADEDRFGEFYLPDREVLPFLECDGVYVGPPRDDAHAISELRRMHQLGATFIAFGWPAFWYLTYFPRFSEYLHQPHRFIMRNEHVVLFRLEEGR